MFFKLWVTISQYSSGLLKSFKVMIILKNKIESISHIGRGKYSFFFFFEFQLCECVSAELHINVVFIGEGKKF